MVDDTEISIERIVLEQLKKAKKIAEDVFGKNNVTTATIFEVYDKTEELNARLDQEEMIEQITTLAIRYLDHLDQEKQEECPGCPNCTGMKQ